MKNKKVIVGLSGGVDSSVAAHLLVEAGYDVEGLFMRNWDSAINDDFLGNKTIGEEICPQEIDYVDAMHVANQLGIVIHRVDFVQEYWDQVFTHFLEEHKAGRTPNPDIICNKEIKFKAFLDHALGLEADLIATGHYARLSKLRCNRNAGLNRQSQVLCDEGAIRTHDARRTLANTNEPLLEGIRLLRGADPNKDQSYFLSQLTRKQLSKAILPLGHLKKSEVRTIAQKLDLVTAKKKDSTGICFIGKRDFTDFLQNYLPAQPGIMMTLKGKVVGNHIGLMYYTIGQRKGLKIGGAGDAWFVIGKNTTNNILFVGQGFHHDYLYANETIVEDVNWISSEKFKGNYLCTAKFRYRQKDVPVEIEWTDQATLKVKCLEWVRAITPGQAAVFYNDAVCLGGGFISEVFMDGKKRHY